MSAEARTLGFNNMVLRNKYLSNMQCNLILYAKRKHCGETGDCVLAITGIENNSDGPYCVLSDRKLKASISAENTAQASRH